MATGCSGGQGSPVEEPAVPLQRHSAAVCSPLGLVSALSGTVRARWQVAVAEQGQDSLLEGSHPSGFIVLWELGQSYLLDPTQKVRDLPDT